MSTQRHSVPFVLATTQHGTMIVNRNDYRMVDRENGYGVGYQLLNTSVFDPEEVGFVLALLHKRHQYFGPGVVAIDCGANIGVHTIEWAKQMRQWGSVYSFEAQEKIFYALAGNVVLNNCLNVTARHCAVGAEIGLIKIPEVSYLKPSSYGSLELREKPTNEYIGQDIDYEAGKNIPMISIDSLSLERVDLIKIDVEGMEEEVLSGAIDTIKRCTPVLFVETIKTNTNYLDRFFNTNGYIAFRIGINVLALHKTDPIARDLTVEENLLTLK